MTYVQFDTTLQDDSIKNKVSERLLQGHPELHKLFNEPKNQIKVKMTTNSKRPHLVVVMFVCHNDRKMISLGEQYEFPRGFPILFNLKENYDISTGFYPKFENDKEKEDDDASKLFGKCKSIRLNYKYSGFLGQVIAFKDGDELCWTTCAKNSTFAHESFDFSADIARIIAPKMTIDLLHHMITNNIFFCGEVMSKNDSSHGARVLSEALVLTMVGISRMTTTTPEGNIVVGSKKIFRTILNQDETFDFAIKFNLDVDNIYTITENCVEFGTELSKHRSNMSLSHFEKLISSMPNIITRKGTVQHKFVLGERLEGLIMKLSLDDHVEIVKYKFPDYTIVTMFLRNIILHNKDTRVSANFKSVCDDIGFWFSPKYSVHLREWVDRWVLVNKDYWYYIGTLIQLHIRRLFKEYNPACNVGFHIVIMDFISQQPEYVFNPVLNYVKLQQELKVRITHDNQDIIELCKYHDVIIAIGANKEQFIQSLVQSKKYVHSNGKNTALLVKEIVSAIEHAKTPVISADYRALFKNGVDLGKLLHSALPYKNLKITLVAPTDCTENEMTFKLLPSFKQIKPQTMPHVLKTLQEELMFVSQITDDLTAYGCNVIQSHYSTFF